MKRFTTTKTVGMAAAGILIMSVAFTTRAQCDSRATSERIVRSPQWNGEAFDNPGANLEHSFGSMLTAGWKFLFADNDRTPDSTLPVQAADLAEFTRLDEDRLHVTWLGHSSLLINIDDFRIATDPVYETKISIFGPLRYNGDVPLDIDSLPDLDLVIVSHNHYDHLNKYTLERIHPKVARFVTPLGVGAELADCGVPASKIVELDWWEEYPIDAVRTIVATPAQHFSGRGVTDRNATLWASWVIKSANHTIFFGGDSGYFPGFADIGAQYGPFDVTFLECGAYNERWHAIHMFPEETVQAHLDLQGKILQPIHWGTFNLSLHPWYDPMVRVARAADSAGVKLATPICGGATDFSRPVPSNRWWEPFVPDSVLAAYVP